MVPRKFCAGNTGLLSLTGIFGPTGIQIFRHVYNRFSPSDIHYLDFKPHRHRHSIFTANTAPQAFYLIVLASQAFFGPTGISCCQSDTI